MVSTQERVAPKLTGKPAPRERTALGRWSPGSPGRFRRQGLILQAASSIRRTMVEYFNFQRQWMAIDDNWMLMATPGQRRRLKKAKRRERRKQLNIILGGIVAWGDWSPNLAAALGPGIGRAMELGANVAQDEVGSFEVDWSLTDPNVANIVRESAFRQAKDIDKITLRRIRGAIGRGLDDGRSTDQIAQSIQNVMSDMSQRRSRLIAQTETIRAQSLGHLQVYEDAGVPAKKWINHRTNFDPICDRLHNQIVALDERFVDPETGKTYSGPPAHPGCQCAIRGVVDAPAGADLDVE